MVRKVVVGIGGAIMLYAIGMLILAQEEQGEIEWIKNYEQGLEKAKSVGRPIMLLFTAPNWCPPCRRLENEAFSNKGVVEATKKLVCVYLHLDHNFKSVKARINKIAKEYTKEVNVSVDDLIKEIEDENEDKEGLTNAQLKLIQVGDKALEALKKAKQSDTIKETIGWLEKKTANNLEVTLKTGKDCKSWEDLVLEAEVINKGAKAIEIPEGGFPFTLWIVKIADKLEYLGEYKFSEEEQEFLKKGVEKKASLDPQKSIIYKFSCKGMGKKGKGTYRIKAVGKDVLEGITDVLTVTIKQNNKQKGRK